MATHDVLRDGNLLRLITSFQCGFPPDILELVRANTDEEEEEERNGLFPRRAASRRDLRMLQRLYQIKKDQPEYYLTRKEMAFDNIWHDSLKHGNVPIIEWVDKQPELRRDGVSAAKISLYGATLNKDLEPLKWLIARRPEYKAHFCMGAYRVVASVGNVEMYTWLENNIKDMPCSSKLMNFAAANGHLKMVLYLHKNRREGSMEEDQLVRYTEAIHYLAKHTPEGAHWRWLE